MKTIVRYLFALCILVGFNQLPTDANSNFLSKSDSQENWNHSGKKIGNINWLANTKAQLPNVAEIFNVVPSKLGTEEKNPNDLNLPPYFLTYYKSLAKAAYLYNSSFHSFFKKHLTYSSCRWYLLFEVFRI
ncbi:hypothetical protein GH721_03970 [Kriegella sp. EG-1]|nr:hypothetical protein [Flavobacteriaceae bacterium EG-1]